MYSWNSLDCFQFKYTQHITLILYIIDTNSRDQRSSTNMWKSSLSNRSSFLKTLQQKFKLLSNSWANLITDSFRKSLKIVMGKVNIYNRGVSEGGAIAPPHTFPQNRKHRRRITTSITTCSPLFGSHLRPCIIIAVNRYLGFSYLFY